MSVNKVEYINIFEFMVNKFGPIKYDPHNLTYDLKYLIFFTYSITDPSGIIKQKLGHVAMKDVIYFELVTAQA